MKRLSTKGRFLESEEEEVLSKFSFTREKKNRA
nr:hypothetical protein MarFTME_109 [Marseillevirus futianmevirus]